MVVQVIFCFRSVFRTLRAFNLDFNEFLILSFASHEISKDKMLYMFEHHRVLIGFARTLLKIHFNENFHETFD